MGLLRESGFAKIKEWKQIWLVWPMVVISGIMAWPVIIVHGLVNASGSLSEIAYRDRGEK